MIPNLLQPQKVHAMSLLYLIPAYFGLYYFVFKWAILKFNIPTPGRTRDGSISLISKQEYKDHKSNEKSKLLEEEIIKALGGVENIESISCCATRLRVEVFDEKKVFSDDDIWKEKLEAMGIVRNKNSLQIIYGTHVNIITAKIKELLDI